MPRFRAVWLLAALALLVSPGLQAERYRIQDDATALNRLVGELDSKRAQLEDLLARVERIEAWRKRLDAEQARLQKESEAAKADRKRLDSGQMTEEEMQQKWAMSGRMLKHGNDLERFKEDVARYNEYLKDYNALARQLMPIIQKRTPEQVAKLIEDMSRLADALREALSRRDLARARELADESPIAAEFGYDPS